MKDKKVQFKDLKFTRVCSFLLFLKCFEAEMKFRNGFSIEVSLIKRGRRSTYNVIVSNDDIGRICATNVDIPARRVTKLMRMVQRLGKGDNIKEKASSSFHLYYFSDFIDCE